MADVFSIQQLDPDFTPVTPGGPAPVLAPVQGQVKDEQDIQRVDAFSSNDLDPDRTTGVRSSLENAFDTTPDQAAKNKELSDQIGLPPRSIIEDPAGVNKALTIREIERNTAGLTTAREFYADPFNAQVASDSSEDISAISRIGNAWEASQLGRQMTHLGIEFRESDEDPAIKAEIAELSEKIAALKEHESNEGFVSALVAASDTVGGMVEDLSDPSSITALAVGAGIGVGVGAVGGVTAVPAGVVGLIAGGASHFAKQAYLGEAGASYIDMRINNDVDIDAAVPISHMVGAINAALELVGIATIFNPLTKATKEVVRQGIRKAALKLGKSEAAIELGKAYATGVLGEVLTEGTEELIQIIGTEIGKSLSGIDDNITIEEATDRIFEVMETTAKGMAILGLASPGAKAVVDIRANKRAEKNAGFANEIATVVQNSPLTKRAPEVMAGHVDDVLQAKGIENVSVPAEELFGWVSKTEDPEATLVKLGTSMQEVETQAAMGQDIDISNNALAQEMMAADTWGEIAPHVRYGVNEKTEQETKDTEDISIPDIIKEQQTLEEEGVVSEELQDPAMDFAMEEMGLKGFLDEALQASMTEKEFQNYLELRAKGIDKANQTREDKALRKEQKKLTKEWKEEEASVRAAIRESTAQEQVYRAFQSINQIRLDRGAVEQILKQLGLTLKDLPKQLNRAIYTTDKTEGGMDPNTHAQLHGYNNANEMIEDFLTTPSYIEAVNIATEKEMNRRHGDLKSKLVAVAEAREALQNNEMASALMLELNAMRKAQGEKKLSVRALKTAAKEYIKSLTIRKIKPNKILASQNRQGREAAALFRKGNLEEASKAKFQQVLNFYVAQEAIRQTASFEKMRNWLNKVTRSKKKGNKLPVQHLNAIRELLSNIDFSKRGKKKSLQDVAHATVAPVPVPDALMEPTISYLDMTLEEFTEVYNVARGIDEAGRTENKLKDKQSQQTVDEAAAEIDGLVRDNLKDRTGINPDEERNFLSSVKRLGFGYGNLLFNMDTILREIDGFVDRGTAFINLKGRIDRGLGEGYRPEQRGYLIRQQETAARLNEIMHRLFTKNERINFPKKLHIPGLVGRQVSHHTILSLILNQGNEGNKLALAAGKNFTEKEIQIILNSDIVTERDYNFAQEIWDMMEELWPEVKASEERRRNFTPEQVEAVSFEKFGKTYRGGYYPIKWATNKGFANTKEEAQELVEQVKMGTFTSSMTKRDHTIARKSSEGNRLFLDLSVIQSHFNQVLYDLEVGDAITDTYRIMYHPDVKNAFIDKGQNLKYEQMQVWLRDAITQEVVPNNAPEKTLRWLRNGFTISKLGWNIGTIAVQAFGLTQAAVVIGKPAVGRGIRILFDSKLTGPDNIFEEIANQSGFMAVRSRTFHKDIEDVRKAFHPTLLDRITPRDFADKFIRPSFFYGIVTVQRYVDSIVWLGAKDVGMKKFAGNEKEAIRFADSAVTRSQASGIFTERTPLERGSLGLSTQQSEFVRAFTPMISYFMAKTNIAAEQFKKTNFKNPAEIVTFTSDMMILYTVEALMVGLVKGQWPEEDDETTMMEYIASESINTLAAGMPILREAQSEISGFRGGGVAGSVLENISQVFTQLEQGEIDDTLLKHSNNLGGILFHYPSSQLNKLLFPSKQTVDDDGELSLQEFLMGPDYTE